ncbi:hypothetical protein SAMN02927937_01396 [Paenimyroides aquimaris]|uniref:Uncharacterized protein n=1 Tax=Paenimyroides marinum TaxID=1159016 RepID=A0A1H6KQF4_9FLAO|nr:hypothetical protein [Paenimyroides aquimaris]SEH78048.1 hypothetical protein SAMN02927937_01396 [Paenimyroides aquimaris]
MKINKLLLFLLALVSLNSCVEYVDNGTEPDGPEKPEEQVFVAKLSEESEGEFVGDEFIFEATLNGVDVTSSTTFKVNGVAVKGNVYKAIKEGENAVLATMDDFTSTFRFTVKEKGEEEPEPTGNRIEYDDNSFEVKTTIWLLNVKSDEDVPYPYELTLQDGSKVLCTKWMMISTSATNVTNLQQVMDSDYYYLSVVYVPVNSDNTVAFPDETTTYFDEGGVKIDTEEYEMEDVEYTFNSVTSTDADYEGEALLENSNTANLFWNGAYMVSTVDLGSKPKNNALSNTNKIEFISKDKIKNLKITK